MKKIFALIMALSFTAGMTVFAENSEEIDYNKWEMLTALNAIESPEIEKQAVKVVSRGDYADWLVKLINCDEMSWAGESLLSDVDESDSCFDSANVIKSMGIFTEESYRPDDKILYSEALEMLLRAMGYDKQLKLESALSIASGMSLPSYPSGGKITYNQLVELFYAAVHEPVMQYDIKTSDVVSLTPYEGETILSKYYEIEITDGIVTGNPVTTLYAPEGRVGMTAIDEAWYSDKQNLGDEWLGFNVLAYIDYSENEDGELVWINKYRKNNSVVEINDTEIESVNERVTEIAYTKDGNLRSEREKISVNAKVIYNGRAFGDYTSADIMPELGKVVLIDNNADYEFDVVKVWSYENIFVNRVYASSETIYNGFEATGVTESICLSDNDDLIYDIYWDGEKCEFSRIGANEIVSVAKSKDGNYIRMELSMKNEKGTLSGVDIADREITFNGETYPIAPNVPREYDKFKFGETYTFYFDVFGNVTAMVYDSGDEYVYGYLYKMVYDDATENLSIQVFDEDGDWHRYDVNEIRYNGKKVDPIFMQTSTDSQRPALTDASGNTTRQIIRMKLDGNVLKAIETAKESAKYGEFNKATETLNYRYQNSSFSSKYYISDKTTIFGIPTTNADDKKAYMISPSLSWDAAYNVTVYEFDEYGDMRVATLPFTASDIPLSNCVVQGTDWGLDADGDLVKTLRCSFGVFEDFAIAVEDTVDLSSIQKGDIVNLTLQRGTGKIKGITVKYSYKNMGEKLYSPDDLHKNDILYGKVIKNDPENKRIIVNLGPNHSYQPLRLNAEGVVIKKYNVRTARCEATSAYALEPGDFVVMETAASKITSVLKYEKE